MDKVSVKRVSNVYTIFQKNNLIKSQNTNDNTTAQGKLPFTGENKIYLISMVSIIIVAIISHNKYFKYKDIK